MIRANIIKNARPLVNARLFSTSMRTMAEGDTGSGASRAGGAAQGDAFTKREAAEEDRYIRQEEIEKIKSIRAKLTQERQHIDALDKSLNELLDKGKK